MGIDVKRVQKTLLRMAKMIAEVLEENDIPYMIAYGTLLGAVRHKGFIPWDDDFDFYLFDDSYDKAIEILRSNLPTDMFIEDEKSEPLYFHAWAHVKDLFSVTACQEFPQDSAYKHKGISVDLYRTGLMPLNELERFLNTENRKYLERRKSKNLISESDLAIRLANLEKREEIVNTCQDCPDEYVYNLLQTDKCHYMRETDVFPLRKYQFEDSDFWGPAAGENILTGIYGNYMELPALEERQCHYSSVQFSDSQLVNK